MAAAAILYFIKVPFLSTPWMGGFLSNLVCWCRMTPCCRKRGQNHYFAKTTWRRPPSLIWKNGYNFAGALKMTDTKMTDQIAGHKNTGHENARHDKSISLLLFLRIPVILAVLWKL